MQEILRSEQPACRLVLHSLGSLAQSDLHVKFARVVGSQVVLSECQPLIGVWECSLSVTPVTESRR